jgi:hypothetical protein
MFLDVRSLLDWVRDAVGLGRDTADHRFDWPAETPQVSPTSSASQVTRPISDGER